MISYFIRLVKTYTAKHFFWATAANVVIVLFGFIFTIIVARNLSPSNYGVFATVGSLILIISDFGEFGIGGGLSRFLPPLFQRKDYESANKVIKTTFIVELLIALVLSIFLVVFSGRIAFALFHSKDEMFSLLVKISIFGVFGFIFYNFINSILYAKEEFKKNFLLSLFYTIPKILLLIVLLTFTSLTSNSVLLVFIVGTFFGILAGFRYVSFDFLKTEGWYPLKKILNFSIFLSINKLFVTLFSRLDILMLSALSNTYEAGLYSLASRFAFISPLIGGSLGTVIAPKYARLSVKEALVYSKKVYLLITFIILFILFVIVFSPFIIESFFSSYAQSTLVLQMLLLASLPFLFTIPINNLLIYTFKKPQVIAFTSLIQLAVIFILNTLLIPKIGTIAPPISIATAASISLIISCSATIYYLKKK